MNENKYINTIWEHRTYGSKVRISAWTETMDNNGCFSRKVYFYRNSKISITEWLDESDFELVYKYVGKVKYTDDQLKKMEFEVQDEPQS